MISKMQDEEAKMHCIPSKDYPERERELVSSISSLIANTANHK
jgi:hypothetical protein